MAGTKRTREFPLHRLRKITPKIKAFVDCYLEFQDIQKACTEKKIDRSYAGKLIVHPLVVEYIDSVKDKLATKEAGKIARSNDSLEAYGVTREALAKRFWDLFSLPPSETNFNITGQVKAGEALRDMMGWGQATGGMTEGGIQHPDGRKEVYRSKWLSLPGPTVEVVNA